MNVHDATEQANRNGYEAGKRDSEPKWIPVTERLPNLRVVRYEDKREPEGYGQWEESDFVLALTEEREIKLLQFLVSSESHKCWVTEDCKEYYKITHWMPLPEPPKE